MRNIPQPEVTHEKSPEILEAEKKLGDTCRSIIEDVDSLSVMNHSYSGINASRASERQRSRHVDTMGATAIKVDNICLSSGDKYNVEVTHSDDAGDGETTGNYDPTHPYANFMMTFYKLIDTPEGRAEQAAFSLEMARRVRGREIAADGNPTHLILWDMDNPGAAQYVFGVSAVETPEFGAMQEIADLLKTEKESQYARFLLGLEPV